MRISDQRGIRMAEEKQDAGDGQDGLVSKLFSRDEAWAKAKELMKRFNDDEEKRFRRVGGYLNIKESCIEVRVSFRSADISDRLNELIAGTEYFVGIKEKGDVLEFPYAIYRVPYDAGQQE
jgi:hypothetical protein